MSTYVMAVDIGWQGTKAAVFDQEMKQISLAFEEANLISPNHATTYQDPQDILGSVRRTIQRAVADSHVQTEDISVVGLSGQMGGIMGMGADGKPVTVYDSWLDTQCAKYSDLMRAKAGKRIIEVTGGTASSNQGPKILWWKHEKPDVYEKIAKFVTPYAFVGMQMCGLDGKDAFYDYTCLHESGFGDNARKCWSTELMDLFDISEDKMPKIVSPFDIIGTVTAEFAKESGLKEGTKVAAGAGDAACAIFGSGFTKPGMVGEFAGALSAITGVCDTYSPDPNGEISMMRSPMDGVWYPMAYTNGTGLAERWFKDTLTGIAPSQYAELDEEAANVQPGSEGVFFVPHFACGAALGGAKGSFVGLDWYVTRGHLFRAMIEGTAYERRLTLDALRAAKPDLDFSAIQVVGGEDRSKLCNRIEADVLGTKLIEIQIAEPALQGAAVIAATAAEESMGAAGALPKPAAGEQTEPAEDTQKQYAACLESYEELMGLLAKFKAD